MAKKKPTAVVKPQKIDSIANIAADLKKELVKNPKEVLNAIEMDFNIAKDKKQKDVTLGQLLESIPATKRNGIAAALVDFIVTNEKVAAVLGKEIGKIIPGDIQIVDENIIRPIPIIPRQNCPIARIHWHLISARRNATTADSDRTTSTKSIVRASAKPTFPRGAETITTAQKANATVPHDTKGP